MSISETMAVGLIRDLEARGLGGQADSVRELLEHIKQMESERKAVASGCVIMAELRFKMKSVADSVADFSVRLAEVEPSPSVVAVVKQYRLRW